jgi:Domain of unknown function (DUF4919)
MQNTVTSLLERYLEEGSKESFLRLRAAVAASPDYAPYDNSPEKALSTVEPGNHENAKSALLCLMGGWLLSPGIHTLLGFMYHKLGDEHGARLEFELGLRCLQGILSTGNGQETSPYLVLHTADEYDVLEHLGKKSLKQRLVTTSQKQAYDVHECEDGVTLWFDVTTPYGHMVAFRERNE